MQQLLPGGHIVVCQMYRRDRVVVTEDLRRLARDGLLSRH